jgi:carboxyl-terminal processing protease
MNKVRMVLLIMVSACLVIVEIATSFCAENITMGDVQKVIETLSSKYVDTVTAPALSKIFIQGLGEGLEKNKIPAREITYFASTSNWQEDLRTADKLMTQAIPQTSRITREKLIEAGLEKMVSSLRDEGTRFYPPGAYHVKLINPSFKGGIGMFIDEEKDSQGRFTIVDTLEGFPAANAHLAPGDRIARVGGKEVKNIELHQLAELVIGEIGSSITISVQQKDRKEAVDFTMDRVALSPNPKNILSTSPIDGMGYIRFKFMGFRMEPETDRIITTLMGEKMKGLIIDLRNNAGYPQAAISLAGLFLPKDTAIATEVFRNSEKVYVAKEKNFTMPLVVLTNEFSSSAATIMAEALRSAGRAKIVGEGTRWRYACTEKLDLSDGSVLTLTTYYYKLPGGRILRNRGEGVKPDFVIKQNPFAAPEDDTQMQKAKELLLQTLKNAEHH